MTFLRGFEGWPSGELHLAIGVFDGVHVGHRVVLERLLRGARAARATTVVATFDPLPARFFDPTDGPLALTEVEHRTRLLHEAGADAVAVFDFDAAFAALTPDEFAGRLAAAGALRRVVVGLDFHFGHDRAGAARTLDALGARHGFRVEVVAPHSIDAAVVSATSIRGLLAEGDLAQAATLLGRPFDIGGVVVRGAGRGTKLGWPTLNIATSPLLQLPRDGIYAGWIEVLAARYPAALSLGVRPTFGAGHKRILEAHLINWSGDLYGSRVHTTFVRRLRDELRFDSVEALKKQIALDVKLASAVLEGA